ncbi:c-di-AMP phosphodiesterase, consists of a GGDEF-like and DHH domains [Virgibacillus subterraneus]|uniref:Cyclic-di-AMP phosphodiesterase n=2 Tax=Virgibacillus TaxID=84406 RepID=A0A1H0XQI5_9BACI|nr:MULTISPECIES: DHH family phosphoesterase [Virgibacillus]SDQ05150.1 c-di-AMP phosphodiesterase, consists of a GGDEF-like and DHH domains [Virgibacillus salinus]SEP59093.1 c-di-AMP phosphodiesterase, consists of a GGDEF-like and DHH domains [Virgibacillus subterraneus]
MHDLQRRPKLSRHLWVIYLLSVTLLGFIWYFQWMLGLLMALLLAASIYYSIRTERTLQNETEEYIATLSHRIKRVGEEALLEMPIGIILYNEDYFIEWANPYMNRFADEDTLVGKSVNTLSDDLTSRIKESKDELWFNVEGFEFQTTIKKEERLLYLFDRTTQSEIQTLYQNEQTVLLVIFLDNYEEITQNMDDTLKSQLNSKVTSVLNNWAHDYGIYMKRTSQDRFLAVSTKEILDQLEKSKFDILDEVRELNAEQNIPITLSIGIGLGSVELPTLGELAQSSLDLALGRGGDQVAIKDEAGKVRFYGGRTNPMEKRTRVRARVISHALKELVKESDNVIIMGHKSPDMDSVGAAIGILNIAKTNGVEGYIVLDPDDVDTGVYRLVEGIKEDEELWEHFIDPEESEAVVTSRSLIVVVDTHKPSMVSNQRLLSKSEYKVVIDHHRRAEEFIDNPTLVYMEPYASSTAELVTELLEYQPKSLKLKMLEATALLAGIIVDTKSFTLRTGSRTFDAASYLRSKGADTVLVQQFMKEDLDIYIKRSKLIERAEVYRDSIAISKGKPEEIYGGVLIAQAADTLLTMSGINASFVISERSDGRIGISARSLGEVNVQIIMEKMNGGGHLTNAATQIEDTTIDDAEALLKDIIEEYFAS